MAEIYDTPDRYDLEHAGAQPDVDFFISQARGERPARILEIACGNGRVTLPLAEAAAAWGGRVTGLDSSEEMLQSARAKDQRELVEWISGDIRSWVGREPFNLVISPCASLSHLLTEEDRIAAWRTAHANLATGGSFIVAELMADFGALAESFQIPPRAHVELDCDRNPPGTQRLLRYKTTCYHAHEQRASIHYLYDKLDREQATDRFVSDYESHVYFPGEMRLLFAVNGFEVTGCWGDYAGRPLEHGSRFLIMRGTKRG